MQPSTRVRPAAAAKETCPLLVRELTEAAGANRDATHQAWTDDGGGKQEPTALVQLFDHAERQVLPTVGVEDATGREGR